MQTLINIAYIVAAILFIQGMKRLQSPTTARSGNQLSALGMLIAVLATLFLQGWVTPLWMFVGLVIGGGIGAFLARRVQMTAMPELVAAFNGFGGLASALVAGAEIARVLMEGSGGTAASVVRPVAAQAAALAGIEVSTAITIALSILIGTVTFSGSFVAFGKLKGIMTGDPVAFPGMRILTGLVTLVALVAIVVMVAGAGDLVLTPAPVIGGALVLGLVALVLGVLMVIPIGGADMPVVVALLNSYSGLAAAATGFVLDNVALIVSGALVGCSGFILTAIMCEAMNRSLANVLLGGFGGTAAAASSMATTKDRNVNATSPQDTAILLSYAEKVIVVPGYGMAVAQAQHQVRELADLLRAQGIEVSYAIHPVAGRMPGHMNVLLAEADVPYEYLYEMDEINPEFPMTDVALVIGANDVVNPVARQDSGSPIAGMPILNVDEAGTVVVIKRSLSPGYSGVDNDLFYLDNTRMLFMDAKSALAEITTEVKNL